MSRDGAGRMALFGKWGSSEWSEILIKELINEREVFMRSKWRGMKIPKSASGLLRLLRT